jgi:hypothetical protein
MQPTITSDQLVRIEHIPGSSVGLLLSDMRTWLDHQEIHPKLFEAITLPLGGSAFGIEFHDPGQTTLFRTAFAPVGRF